MLCQPPHLTYCCCCAHFLLQKLIIIICWQRCLCSLCQFQLIALLLCQVDLHLWGRQGDLLHEGQLGVAGELPRQVEERLLIVVVTLGGDLIILQVLFAMEGDLLGLHLSILNVHLVPTQHDGDVLADTTQVSMPGGHVLVSEPRSDVEHDDGALAVDVIAITQPAEFLLASCVPAVEANLATVGGEVQRPNLHADRGLVLLLELAREMAFDEGGLACSTVANKHQLECGHTRRGDLPGQRHS
mmetsp:Transcript_18056/g.30899  ORF Transcript_18056/g.30899 Transcript_18056/m.30899 type:complete len:243 (+) Transcript_18056:514-1242(+)